MKKKLLVERFRYTAKELSSRCDALDGKLQDFESLTQGVCSKLAALHGKKKRQLPASIATYLGHWWRWWIILKDEKLELHNGELRYEELHPKVFKYRNNFDMKPKHYYKSSKKQYSGEALDDMRDALRSLQGRISDDLEEVVDMQFNALSDRMSSHDDRIKSMSSKIIATIGHSAGVSPKEVHLNDTDLEEFLNCKHFGIFLKRPAGDTWVAKMLHDGIFIACASSSDEDVEVLHRITKPHRSKRRRKAFDDSSDEDECVDAIKRAAGKDEEAMAESRDILEAEEARTIPEGGWPLPYKDMRGVEATRIIRDYNGLGKAAEENGDWELALKWHRKDVTCTTSPSERSIALRNVGVCFVHLRRPDEALIYLQEALAAVSSLSKNESSFEDLCEIERCYIELGNLCISQFNQFNLCLQMDKAEHYLDLAIRYYQMSNELAQKLLADPRQDNDHADRLDCASRSTYNCGRALYVAAKFKESVSMLSKSVDFGNRLKFLLSDNFKCTTENALQTQREAIQGDAFSILGDGLVEINRFDDARDAYNKALSIFRRFKDIDGDWPVGDTLAKLAALDIESAATSEDSASRAELSQAALESIDLLELETCNEESKQPDNLRITKNRNLALLTRVRHLRHELGSLEQRNPSIQDNLPLDSRESIVVAKGAYVGEETSSKFTMQSNQLSSLGIRSTIIRPSGFIMVCAASSRRTRRVKLRKKMGMQTQAFATKSTLAVTVHDSTFEPPHASGKP